MRFALSALAVSMVVLLGQASCDTDEDGDGWTVSDGDCDDGDAEVHPGADEYCDGIDNDCNRQVDDDPEDGTTWYADADADGYGNAEDSLVACEAPTGYVENDQDCDDSDSSITPETSCDFVVHFQNPGNAYVYVSSLEANDVQLETGGEVVAAFSLEAEAVDTSLYIGAGAYSLRGGSPFLVHIVSPSSGGDEVVSARGYAGEYLSDTLMGWAGEYMVIQNPAEVDAEITLQGWSDSGWTDVSSDTVPAGGSTYFTVSWGYYRVNASSEVWAYGYVVNNIENHMEYIPANDGAMVGENFMWMIPVIEGAVGLVGQCVDVEGCVYETLEDGASVASGSLVEGEVWSIYVQAGVLYEVSSSGLMILRDEATPYGFSASDGTTMDSDLVPGMSGVDFDTDFVMSTTIGIATSYTDRRSDLYAIGYSDETSVEVEQMIDGGWSSIGSMSLSAGDVTAWGTDIDPSTVLRFTSDAPIHLQLSQISSEYSWAVFSDYQEK